MPAGNSHKSINVRVVNSNESITVHAGNDSIEIENQSSVPANSSRLDYVAWFVLPIAMRQNADIKIQGTGSRLTADNAYKMSQIWESWMPSRFSSVKVTFSDFNDEEYHEFPGKNLCLYSGGVDSTYTILNRHKEGLEQDLLTVHGMDYKYYDKEKFRQLIAKGEQFTKRFSGENLFVRTNAYEVYDKYKVNTKGSHITHIFSLAGSSFLFSEVYPEITISADYRLDQQFTAHPWGSNSATNSLFNDGRTFLRTDSDDVTRSGKMAALMHSDEALSSLSFCVDYSSRPENCGRCPKCIRTKLMFMAATGVIPEIFVSPEIAPEAIAAIDLTKKSERTFFLDLYHCAKESGRLTAMPYLEDAFARLKTIDGYSPSQTFFSYCKKRLLKKIKS